MNETKPYTLYGAPASLYTGKVRSYLRKQGINFVEMAPGSDRYLNHIMPAAGRWIIPCMETPDGTIVQDGADIIDHFEKGEGQSLRRYSSYPESPTLLAISHLFELFGGEGLLRPAMHYRWNFDDQNLAFIINEFALMAPNSLTAEQKEESFLKGSGRMRKAAVHFGATPETASTVEAAFAEWLELFSAHLLDHPYLLGGQPTLGDYALMGPMWAHLFRDPAPASLIKRVAPRVGRWVERMSTSEPYEHEYEPNSDLVDGDAIPDTLRAMMQFVSEEYLGELTAHVDVANEWLAAHPEIEPGTNGLENPADRGLAGRGPGGAATFDWRGHEITTGVLPYRFWLMQRLHDDLAGASADDQAKARSVFEAANCESFLDLRTVRRVERANNLEVWA